MVVQLRPKACADIVFCTVLRAARVTQHITSQGMSAGALLKTCGTFDVHHSKPGEHLPWEHVNFAMMNEEAKVQVSTNHPLDWLRA